MYVYGDLKAQQSNSMQITLDRVPEDPVSQWYGATNFKLWKQMLEWSYTLKSVKSLTVTRKRHPASGQYTLQYMVIC